jgi:hypothetical protein
VVVSGEKGLWSVAEEALLPRSRVGRGILSGLRVDFFCGGFCVRRSKNRPHDAALAA